MSSKLQIEVEDYEKSQAIEINTYGVSGIVKLKKKKTAAARDQSNGQDTSRNNLMDVVLDSKN
jgi:hypothetical protein